MKSTIQDIKTISLLGYLQGLGLELAKIRGGQYWYKSPFKVGDDKTPSFMLEPKKNVFNCFATGKRGDIIRFVQEYHKLSFSEALKHLEEYAPTFAPLPSFLNGKIDNLQIPNKAETPINIKSVKPLANTILLDYIHQRKINIDIAKTYLKEVYYEINGKRYFAVSFENDLGGLELRNKYFKGSTSPKAIKTIVGQKNDACLVFEGCFDFLSYLTLKKNKIPPFDSIILNSNTNKDKADMLKYSNIYLALDNDESGKEAVLYFKSKYENVKDESHNYSKYKDLNDFLISKRY